jgi:hypothetical protein
MPVIERTLTEMLRESGDVLREAEHQDVVLRRRDGADVMLVDLERETGLRQSLADAARIIGSLHGSDDALLKNVIAALPSAIAWTQFLPEAERLTFLKEFSATAAACYDAQVFEPLSQLDREWRATAAVYADPRLAAVLTEGAEDDLGPVPRPHV